jgi:hypothetical protein
LDDGGESKAIPDDLGGKEPSLWIIGGQKFDDAEPVLLILPVRLEIVFELRSQDRQISSFQSFGSKLAIHRRYTERRLLSIPSCYLQGITVRPVPCNYNVIQSVSALSRRRRGFKSKRKMGSISQVSRRGLRPRGQGIPPVGKPVLSTFDDVNEIAATFSVRQ